jgi:hypothetical protein
MLNFVFCELAATLFYRFLIFGVKSFDFWARRLLTDAVDERKKSLWHFLMQLSNDLPLPTSSAAEGTRRR